MQRLNRTHHGPLGIAVRSVLSSLVLIGGLVVLAAPSWAAVAQRFKITNNSIAARSDLHLVFTGTGGTATLTVDSQPPVCGPPVVTNPGSPWDITWPSACIGVGGIVTVTITTAAGGAVFSSGTWSPGSVPLAAGDVTAVAVPGVSPWALGLLGLLIAASGAVALGVRRKARTEGSLPA